MQKNRDAHSSLLHVCEDLRSSIAERFRNIPTQALVATILHPNFKDLAILEGPHNEDWRNAATELLRSEYQKECILFAVSFSFLSTSLLLFVC